MTEAVNLAFKGILLSPVFILCIFITIAMLKHMIFGGIPTMNQPSEAQREELQQRDSEVDPRTVWGGERQPTEEPSSALDRVTNPVEINTPVPFTIYDGPEQAPKYIEPAGWNGEILEDPFS